MFRRFLGPRGKEAFNLLKAVHFQICLIENHLHVFARFFEKSTMRQADRTIKMFLKFLEETLDKWVQIVYYNQACNRAFHMEKSRSWPSAHDWKSCIPQKGIEGSNPSFSAKTQNPRDSKGFGFFLALFVGEFRDSLQTQEKELYRVFLSKGFVPSQRRFVAVFLRFGSTRLVTPESTFA